MTHDIVGLTDQLSALETTGKHKLIIARNDTALEVGPADDGRPRFEGVFLLNDGQVLSHLFFLMAFREDCDILDTKSVTFNQMHTQNRFFTNRLQTAGAAITAHFSNGCAQRRFPG